MLAVAKIEVRYQNISSRYQIRAGGRHENVRNGLTVPSFDIMST